MATIEQLRTEIRLVLEDFHPETMTGEQAAAAVERFGAIERAAAAGRMLATRRVEQTDAWRGQGHLSTSDWAAAKAGISVRAAASQLSTAKKAERLPKTQLAMRRGELSPDQAGAVTDAATADPSAEDDLLDMAANDTTANLKREAARRKAAATDRPERERRNRAQRSVRRYTDSEGAYNLHLRGPASDGVRLDARLRPYDEQAFRTARTDGVRDSYENRAYDAFFALLDDQQEAGSQLATQPSDEPAAASTPTASSGSPAKPAEGPATDAPAAPAKAKKPPGGNNIKVIVRIDHTALARGHTIAGETCDVAGLGPIPVSAAKELMADAFIAAVITKGRDVINAAHLGRGLNAHQRTAIEAIGLRCSNIACNRTIATQIDHRVTYNDDQITKLDNQDPFCPVDHNRKTNHGWNLEEGTGPRRFLPPGHPDNPGPQRPERREGQAAAASSASSPLPAQASARAFEEPALC